MKKPLACKKEHMKFLDDLRRQGFNMGRDHSAPTLKANFLDLSLAQAEQIVKYWKATFIDRHPPTGIKL